MLQIQLEVSIVPQQIIIYVGEIFVVPCAGEGFRGTLQMPKPMKPITHESTFISFHSIGVVEYPLTMHLVVLPDTLVPGPIFELNPTKSILLGVGSLSCIQTTTEFLVAIHLNLLFRFPHGVSNTLRYSHGGSNTLRESGGHHLPGRHHLLHRELLTLWWSQHISYTIICIVVLADPI